MLWVNDGGVKLWKANQANGLMWQFLSSNLVAFEVSAPSVGTVWLKFIDRSGDQYLIQFQSQVPHLGYFKWNSSVGNWDAIWIAQ